jgi:hypothetical protein
LLPVLGTDRHFVKSDGETIERTVI